MAKDKFGFGIAQSPAGPYESLRQEIKKSTGGLGGLLLTTNKKTGERSFVITYADTPEMMKSQTNDEGVSHHDYLQYVSGKLGESEEMPNVRKIQAMTSKESNKLQKYVDSSMKKLIKKGE